MALFSSTYYGSSNFTRDHFKLFLPYPSPIPLLPAQRKDSLCKLPSKPSNRQRIIHRRLRIDHSLILSFQLPRSANTTLFRCLRPFSRRKNPESVCANLRRTSRASSPFQTPFPHSYQLTPSQAPPRPLPARSSNHPLLRLPPIPPLHLRALVHPLPPARGRACILRHALPASRDGRGGVAYDFIFSVRGMAGGVECVSLVGVEVREDGVLLVFEGLVVCFVYRCVKGGWKGYADCEKVRIRWM